MSLGADLRRVRHERKLSLRDVERLSNARNIGSKLSSGYLSMLERGHVKEPAPRMLFSLAAIYEIDFIDLMRKAEYIPDDTVLKENLPAKVVFRGSSQLSEEQKDRVQRIIDFELSEFQAEKRKPWRRDRLGS